MAFVLFEPSQAAVKSRKVFVGRESGCACWKRCMKGSSGRTPGAQIGRKGLEKLVLPCIFFCYHSHSSIGAVYALADRFVHNFELLPLPLKLF